MKPWIHALSSVKQFGGEPEDYLEIHNFLDSSKSVIADIRHRALTHNSWFLSVVMERIFGVTITNSDGKKVSVRNIAEQHVSEDYAGFIPSAQDFLQEIELQPWMNNGRGTPPSCAKLYKKNRALHKKEGNHATTEEKVATNEDRSVPGNTGTILSTSGAGEEGKH